MQDLAEYVNVNKSNITKNQELCKHMFKFARYRGRRNMRSLARAIKKVAAGEAGHSLNRVLKRIESNLRSDKCEEGGDLSSYLNRMYDPLEREPGVGGWDRSAPPPCLINRGKSTCASL